jgi:hypothetical protein
VYAEDDHQVKFFSDLLASPEAIPIRDFQLGIFTAGFL